MPGKGGRIVARVPSNSRQPPSRVGLSEGDDMGFCSIATVGGGDSG